MSASDTDRLAARSTACGSGSGRRPSRSKSLAPNHASSAWIWWLIALWVTHSSSAAALNEPARTTVSKTRSAFRGGVDVMTLLA